jgi:hypothetical protein
VKPLGTRLATLFLTSLLGVLVIVGLVLAQLGWAAEAPYLLVVVVGLGVLLRKARTLKREATGQHADGRTCSCCTSTVFDPVEVR